MMPMLVLKSPPRKLHSLPYKQPGPVLTLIYTVAGHPQQAPLWCFLYSTERLIFQCNVVVKSTIHVAHDELVVFR